MGQDRIAAGSKPLVNPSVDQTFIDPGTWSRIADLLNLSPRELEITQGIFDQANEEDIADRLRISKHTVHMHVVRLYHKLRIHSRVALVLRIIAARDSLNSNGRGH